MKNKFLKIIAITFSFVKNSASISDIEWLRNECKRIFS